MNASRISKEVDFVLRFYDQSLREIQAVVLSAMKSHPSITSWSHSSDGGITTDVKLKFRDDSARAAFKADDRFVDEYLAKAWGRKALTRDALRVKPEIDDERGTIPSDMFGQIGI